MKRFTGLLAVLLLFGSLLLFAQTETGSISGTATDVTGAVVPNAKITVTSTSTGAVRNLSTNSQGFYTASNLQPGVYRVKVEAPGFAPFTQEVQVTVGGRIGLDPKLAAGGSSTTIEVVANAGGVQVNTENQTVGQVVSSQSIMELPTITRDYTALAATSGSVSGDAGGSTGRGVGVSINGNRAASTSILLDGGENVDYFGAGVGQNVPLDSVQEFSILTANFTPEYGRASGGVVNVATKQGTNNLHGSAYEYYRGSGLGANSPQNKANELPRDRYDRHQFGYSIGGPIVKDKLFFFNNIEWIRVRSAQQRQYLVPTPEFIAAAAPATQDFFAAYGSLVKPIDTVFTKSQLIADGSGLSDAPGTPWGNIPGDFPVLGQVTTTVPVDAGGGDPSNHLLGVLRLDYNMTDKTQFFARWGAERVNAFAGSNSDSPYAGYNTGYVVRNNNYLLSMVHVFAPSFVSQSKVVYNRLNNLQPVNGPDLPTLFWKGTRAFILGKYAYLPGYLPGNPGSGIPFGGPQNLYQFYQDFNWSLGKHQVRFGGNYIHMRDNRVFGAYEMAPEQLGANTTDGFSNFLNGQLISFRSAIYPQGHNACAYDYATQTYVEDQSCAITLPATTPKFGRNNRYNDYALYVNDNWKIVDRLSLNLGMRYEYYGVQHNADPSLDANFYWPQNNDPFPIRYREGTAMLAKDSPVHGLWAPDKNNFAPRVGFAWDVFGDGKTSIRGGFGIFYERNFGNVTFNVIQNPPNYAVISITPADVGGNLPIYTDNLGPFAGTGATKYLESPSLRNVSQNIRTAYTEEWNFGIEHQLSPSMIIATTYTGNRGLKLYSLEDYNRLGSGVIYNGDDPSVDPFSRMNMQYGVGSFNRGNRGFSDYHGLNVRVQANNLWQSGLSFVSNYTWSHAIDNLSSTFSDSYYNYNVGLLDPFNPGLDKGNADFDVRHRFVFAGNWQEPYFKNSSNALLKWVAGGWEIAPILTASTGTPFTIFDCTNGFFYCPRLFQTATSDASTRGAVAGTNEYDYLNVPTVDFSQTYANPLIGLAEIGNCTTPGQGLQGPCPWPDNMTRRNAFRGPSNWNMNFGIYKNFQVTERVKLQLRGELYNAFNHPNDYIDNGTIDAASSPIMDSTGTTRVGSKVLVKRGFRPNGTSDKRDVQLALRINF